MTIKAAIKLARKLAALLPEERETVLTFAKELAPRKERAVRRRRTPKLRDDAQDARPIRSAMGEPRPKRRKRGGAIGSAGQTEAPEGE